MEQKDALIEKIWPIVQVEDSNDMEIPTFNGGKLLHIKVPTLRLTGAFTYDAAITGVASAMTYAIVYQVNIDAFDALTVKAVAWGSDPQTQDMEGAHVTSILTIPQNNERIRYALRNISVNHFVLMTKRIALQGAALAAMLETAGIFEKGGAFGLFERNQILYYRDQGLNENNMAYDIVKANGQTGSVVQSLVIRTVEDGVITPVKKGEYFQFYDTKDLKLWNAYVVAGSIAASIVNCGAGRFEHDTGLPGFDFGSLMATALGFSFVNHSIYCGGGMSYDDPQNPIRHGNIGSHDQPPQTDVPGAQAYYNAPHHR
ncbi:MAG: hypothetical protein WCF90_05695 [Methanomicrobiales archaeon]